MDHSHRQDAKEQVRQATDIVDLVGSYLALRRQGRGYVAHCPWHDDTRPSLQVNPERQSFKCWVCDIGGDVFSFTMLMEGLEFRESLEMLAERAGISLAPQQSGSGTNSIFNRRNLFRVLAWAEEQFHQYLLESPEAGPARDYLRERGIAEETSRKFHLGFSPDRWDWLMNRAAAAGHPPALLERVGLVIQRSERGGYYDRFRGRLLFSIRDVRSRPIAFGGRILPEPFRDNTTGRSEEAKYINSPETTLFSKKSQLYALDLARDGIAREGGLVVMEGYTDVIMAHQYGIENAVAVLGTALGDQHIPLIRRFTDRITLVLDGDDAGQQRTMQILDELLALFVEQEIDLQFLALPKGCDPCDVIAKQENDSQGSDAFRQLLSQSVDAIEHKIRAVTNGLAHATDTHRSARAVEEILGTLARVRMSSRSTSSPALLREQQVLARLSREFGLGEEQLRTRLSAIRRELSTRRNFPRSDSRNRKSPETSGPEVPTQSARPQLTVWEEELMELLLVEPHVMEPMAGQLAPEDMQTDAARNLFQIALQLHGQGITPAFNELMLRIDDPAIKDLLVHFDERGHAKSGSDVEQRLNDLFADHQRRKDQADCQADLAKLKQRRLDPEQEDQVLADLFAHRKRSRQDRTSQTPTPEPQGDRPMPPKPDF